MWQQAHHDGMKNSYSTEAQLNTEETPTLVRAPIT